MLSYMACELGGPFVTLVMVLLSFGTLEGIVGGNGPDALFSGTRAVIASWVALINGLTVIIGFGVWSVTSLAGHDSYSNYSR